jgi:hypothetical protein
MKRLRRNHSPALKAKVALEALKSEKTKAQFAFHYYAELGRATDGLAIVR